MASSSALLVQKYRGIKDEGSTSAVVCVQIFDTPLPRKMLSDIQCLFDEYVWEEERPRIQNLIMQQKKAQGGLALPNIRFYSQAALMENCI